MRSTELQRTTPPRRTDGLKRGAGPRRKTPLGHCTPAQRERVRDLACIVCGECVGYCDPAHVIPRAVTSVDAANDVRAVVPLCPIEHRAYDEGRLDLSPYLEPRWRDSAEWAVGAVGLFAALRQITGERWVPAGDRMEAVA
jgi:ferredoxin